MDSARQKWVNLCYVVGGALLGWVVYSLSENLIASYDLERHIPFFDYVLPGVAVLSGVGLFLYFYLSDVVNQYMNETLVELSRVTWPTAIDTRKATIVVMIMVLIAGTILGLLDSLWTWSLKFLL
jgi:preprotein translocase SecE subunit